MNTRLKGLGILIVTLLLACPAWGQQDPDFGDAPDPSFPSLSASGGPTHFPLTDSYVGWASTGEPNALVPDLDTDDGVPLIFADYFMSGWYAWVYVPITIAPGAPPQTPRYLNVLLDCNSSGTWCDQPGEWIVRNYVLPSYGFVHNPGQTVWYCIGGFNWVSMYSGYHWLRVTLGDAPVLATGPNGWNGSWPPGFGLGETEDWLLSWYYHPPQPPDPPGTPPWDPGNPPGPAPIPQCNKTGTIHQVPPPTHHGHSGGFGVEINNTSPDHPMHIVSGPIVTDLHGDPIDIEIESLASTIIPPGGKVQTPAGWGFLDKAPNQAWGNLDAVVDPQGLYVVLVNVGNYVSPTSLQPTGLVFAEVLVPTGNGMWLGILIAAIALASVYLIVRRYRMPAKC
ncbi:MAG: hypothetical protein V2A71_00690 [Candidatus Eisenbacteria bacterium]